MERNKVRIQIRTLSHIEERNYRGQSFLSVLTMSETRTRRVMR